MSTKRAERISTQLAELVNAVAGRRTQLLAIVNADDLKCPPCMASCTPFGDSVHCSWCPSGFSARGADGVNNGCALPCQRAVLRHAQDKVSAAWLLELNEHHPYGPYPELPSCLDANKDNDDQMQKNRLSRFWNAVSKMKSALSDAEGVRRAKRARGGRRWVSSEEWLQYKGTCNGKCEQDLRTFVPQRLAVMAYVFIFCARAA